MLFLLVTLIISSSQAYDDLYRERFPSFIEYSSGTQVKSNYDGDGGAGGHGAIYIEGLCKDYSVSYPKVKVCDPHEKLAVPHTGVGISLDKQFKNVKWTAVPGYEFFMNGEVSEGEKIDSDVIDGVIKKVVDRKIFEGIIAHEKFISPSFPRAEYEKIFAKQSMATDFALRLGRAMTSHRVPLNPSKLSLIADYLNGINEPFITGKKSFQWSGIDDNCAHLSANVFALVGIRSFFKVHAPKVVRLFYLTTPKNGLITIENKTNFRPIDLKSVWNDVQLRQQFIEYGELPMGPGSLTRHLPVFKNNEYFKSDLIGIKLPQEPILRSFQYCQRHLMSQSMAAFTELKDNARYWIDQYDMALEQSKDRSFCKNSECIEFGKKYSEWLLKAKKDAFDLYQSLKN